MRPFTLVFLGVVVFLLSAILLTPAAQLYTRLMPQQAGVQIQGLSGTVSEGAAAQVLVRNIPAVGDIHWKLQAWKLLLGKASFHISAGNNGLLVDGVASVVPSGTASLENFRLNSPITALAASAGFPFVPVIGTIGVQVDSFKLRKGWPSHADAVATVRGLSWKLGRNPVLLGDFQAVVSDETGGIRALISTLEGPLEVSGEAHAKEDRSWDLHIQMKPRPNAPPELSNIVSNLGQADTQGWYHLRRKGAATVQAKPIEVGSQ